MLILTEFREHVPDQHLAPSIDLEQITCLPPEQFRGRYTDIAGDPYREDMQRLALVRLHFRLEILTVLGGEFRDFGIRIPQPDYTDSVGNC